MFFLFSFPCRASLLSVALLSLVEGKQQVLAEGTTPTEPLRAHEQFITNKGVIGEGTAFSIDRRGATLPTFLEEFAFAPALSSPQSQLPTITAPVSRQDPLSFFVLPSGEERLVAAKHLPPSGDSVREISADALSVGHEGSITRRPSMEQAPVPPSQLLTVPVARHDPLSFFETRLETGKSAKHLRHKHESLAARLLHKKRVVRSEEKLVRSELFKAAVFGKEGHR